MKKLKIEGPNGAIYYGLGVTEHSQGSSTVIAIANLAMVTGNIGRRGVGVNPLRGQNNVQGSCDMGSFPHEFPGYRHVSNDAARGIFEERNRVLRAALRQEGTPQNVQSTSVTRIGTEPVGRNPLSVFGAIIFQRQVCAFECFVGKRGSDSHRLRRASADP